MWVLSYAFDMSDLTSKFHTATVVVIIKKVMVFCSVLVVHAVSLARRLQDPLAELVKVEPKHLGVGMYQHDVPEKQLNCTLDEVVVECVSFVGVDVNVASPFLLR